MNVTPFLNVVEGENVADISITGDIGYNYFADNKEDYEKNTSEAMAKELQSIQDLNVSTINVTLESLGGDVFHALAIYSMLKKSGATINTYYRGANASASTIIGSAASSVDNIHMDKTGLFLVHLPMIGDNGNKKDKEAAIKNLDKAQAVIENTYSSIGVTVEVSSELMSRNSGKGEWLTFEEAKEYGFVGKAWETKKVVNYSKATFQNKGILIPDNKLINQKPIEMDNKEIVLNDAQEKTLFAKFKAYFKNETEAEELERAKAKELEDLKAELAEATAKIAELETPAEVVDEKVETTETAEVVEEVAEEVSMQEAITNAVKAEIKNLIEPTNTKETKNAPNKNLQVWEQHLNNFQNRLK